MFKASGETDTTEAQCARNGFNFVPMIIEAHGGGWGRTARQTLDVIAKHVSIASGEHADSASLKIAQRLSTTLHRENARAILQRLQQQDGDAAVDLLVPP